MIHQFIPQYNETWLGAGEIYPIPFLSKVSTRLTCLLFESRMEIDATLDRLKKAERDLRSKEKELKNREKKIKERERSLEKQFKVVVGVVGRQLYTIVSHSSVRSSPIFMKCGQKHPLSIIVPTPKSLIENDRKRHHLHPKYYKFLSFRVPYTYLSY